jgi:hypothetical protein
MRALLWVVIAAGCASPGPAPQDAEDAPLATGVVGQQDVDPYVRAVHHMLDVDVADVWMNAAPEPFVVGFPLGASSAFLDFFPPGTYTMDLTVTGTDEVAARFEDVDVSDGEAFTLVAVGFHLAENQDAFGGEPAVMRTLLLPEDLSNPPEGLARIHVFNAVIGGLLFAPTGLDIYVDGALLVDDLDYAEDVTLELAWGEHELGFDYGEDGVADRTLAIDLDPADFEGAAASGFLSLMPGNPLDGEDLVSFALLYYPQAQEPSVFSE